MLLYLILGALMVHSIAANGHCRKDLAVLFDKSGSIDRDQTGDAENRLLTRNFVSELVNALDIGPDDTRVGLISFANEARVVFAITTDTGTITNGINGIPASFEGGKTNTQQALERAGGMFDENFRSDTERVIVLITDGKPTRETTMNNNLEDVANQLKARGVTIIGIGVTNQVGESLIDIVSNPEEDFLNVTTFSELTATVTAVRNKICPEQIRDPVVCLAPEDGVAFSAHSAMPSGGADLSEGNRVMFGSVFSNRGGYYNTQMSAFMCPCRGMYSFTATLSDAGTAKVVIMRNTDIVSALGASTYTIIECNENDEVYVRVGRSEDDIAARTFGVYSLHSFSGRLEFSIP